MSKSYKAFLIIMAIVSVISFFIAGIRLGMDRAIHTAELVSANEHGYEISFDGEIHSYDYE